MISSQNKVELSLPSTTTTMTMTTPSKTIAMTIASPSTGSGSGITTTAHRFHQVPTSSPSPMEQKVQPASSSNDNDDAVERFHDEMPLEITDSVRTNLSVDFDNHDDNDHNNNNNNNDNNNDDSHHRISWLDACMHLIKGNLGPGCLNIPHAFVLSGWFLGSALFLIVAIQGIYSMYILSYCKDLLAKHYHYHSYSSQQQQQQVQMQDDPNNNNNNATTTASPAPTTPTPTTTPTTKKFTFMTVAQYALGSKLHVQIFLFALQVGVCCVFLSLLATNLHAQVHYLSSTTCVLIITTLLLGIVLQRFLKDLRWLSTCANVLMIIAIVTACVYGISEYRKNNNNNNNNNKDDNNTNSAQIHWGTSNWGDIATFVSAMFFSFEGIGLVLPVENSFTAGYTTLEETSNANGQFRKFVLPGAMSIVGILFIAIGISASLGFPDIESGSITAYLDDKYPNNLWLDIVNVLVMLAVFMTFPLQLTPAMEVLEDWLYGEEGEEGDENGEGGRGGCCRRARRIIASGGGLYHFQVDHENGILGANIERVDSTDIHRTSALLEEAIPESDDDDHYNNNLTITTATGSGAAATATATTTPTNLRHQRRCCHYYRGYLRNVPTTIIPLWILQRYMIIFGCAIVVILVDDLGLLMSLFGAVGQTGLALMPCVIHWNLQQQGIAPKNRILQVLDVFTIGFSGIVMIAGVGFSIQKLVQQKSTSSST